MHHAYFSALLIFSLEIQMCQISLCSVYVYGDRCKFSNKIDMKQKRVIWWFMLGNGEQEEMERNLKEHRSHSKNGSLSGKSGWKAKLNFSSSALPMCLYSRSRFPIIQFEMKAIRSKRNKKRDAGICLMPPQRKKMILMKRGCV